MTILLAVFSYDSFRKTENVTRNDGTPPSFILVPTLRVTLGVGTRVSGVPSRWRKEKAAARIEPQPLNESKTKTAAGVCPQPLNLLLSCSK
jgi:hypothetical protein